MARHGLMRSDDDAHVARTLQRGLLPTAVPEITGLAISTHYRAGGRGDVGGDWYDVLNLPEGGVAVVIGDVAGHGVTAAMTMAQLRFAVRAYLFIDDAPSTVLDNLNRLAGWVLPGEVATALIAVFLADGDEVRLASAGHLPPVITSPHRNEYLSVEPAPALGINPDATFPETVARIAVGDGLVLFTDGLVERRGESIDDGLGRLLRACAGQSHATLLDHLVATVPDTTAEDDLAAVAVARTET